MAKITTSLFGELALLPYQAEAPVSETLEWLNGHHVSFNGTEEITPLRTNPRQRFTYEIPDQPIAKLRSYIEIYNAMKLRWAVPIWTEGQYIGSVAINSQVITCNTHSIDFRPNTLALLYESFNKWQVVEIVEVGPVSITLLGFTQAFQSALLLPIRLGYLDGDVRRSSTGHASRTKVSFQILDIQTLPDLVVPGTTRFQLVQNQVNTALDVINAKRLESGVTVHIRVIAFSSSAAGITRRSVTTEGITEIKNWIGALAVAGGTAYDIALQSARSYFLTPTPANFQQTCFFITDGEPEPVSSAENAANTCADMITRTGSFSLASGNDVNIRALSIDLYNTQYLTLLDNTPDDGVPILSSSNPNVLRASIFGSSSTFSEDQNICFVIDRSGSMLQLAGPSTFVEEDLYITPGLLNEKHEQTLATRVDKVDYSLGLVERRYPWLNIRDSRPKQLVLNGPDEVREFKLFLARRQGSFRRYWEPTFEYDIRHVNTGLVSNILLVSINDKLTEYPLARTNIAVATINGAWHCRSIISVAEPAFGTVELTLDNPLSLQASEILFISFLGLRRLSTDRVEINWIGGGVATTSFTTVEVQP
jgi:hypothetical protein